MSGGEENRYILLTVSLPFPAFRLSLSSPTAIPLSLTLQRGGQRRRVQGSIANGVGAFSETVTHHVIVKRGEEARETIKGTVNMETVKGKRKIGEITLHLGDRIDTGQWTVDMPLQGCPDKTAALTVQGRVDKIKEIGEEEYRKIRAEDPDMTTNPEGTGETTQYLDATIVQDAGTGLGQPSSVQASAVSSIPPQPVSNTQPVLDILTPSPQALMERADDMMGEVCRLGDILKGSVIEAIGDIQSMEQKIQTIHAQIVEARADRDKEKKRADELSVQVSTLSTRVHSLETDLSSSIQRESALTSKISTMSAEMSEQRERIEGLVKSEQTMRESIDQYRQREDRLKAEIEGMRQNGHKEDKDRDRLEGENRLLTQTVLARESDCSDLKEQITALEDGNAELEIRLEGMGARLQENKILLEESEEEKKKLSGEIDSLKKAGEESKKMIFKLQTDIEALKREKTQAVTAAANTVSPMQLKYYQELEKKYVQAKKYVLFDIEISGRH